MGKVRQILQGEEVSCRKGFFKRRCYSRKIFALILVLLSVICFVMEFYNGAISNILAPVYGSSRTEMNGGIGVPIDAVTSEDGYTLTVEAIIRDQEEVVIVYTFEQNNGQEIPDEIYFKQWGINSSEKKGELVVIKSESNPSQVRMVERLDCVGIPIGRISEARFSGLSFDKEFTDEVAQGPWRITFVLRYRKTSIRISKDFEVKGTLGSTYLVHQIDISPVNLRLLVTAPTPLGMGESRTLFDDFDVVVKLRSGEEIPVIGAFGAGWNDEDETVDVQYEESFREPIFLEDVESLIICDMMIPLHK